MHTYAWLSSGVTGILSGQVAAHLGAQVTVVDKVADRAAIAAEVGLDDFVLNDGVDLAGKLMDGRSGFDVVIDTVGSDELAAVATTVLRPGGVIVAVAAPTAGAQLTVDYGAVYRKELSLVASRNYTRADFREAIALLDAGHIDPRPLVTARLPLKRAGDALRMLADRPENHVKVRLER